jgi:hypothetical protein
LGQQLLLFRSVSDTRPELVDPSVDADFMTPARHDGRHYLRMQQHAHRWNEEGRGHLMSVQEVQNPRHGRRRSVFADRQWHGQGIRALQQFVVDIE